MKKVIFKAPVDFLCAGEVKHFARRTEYVIDDETVQNAFVARFIASCEEIPTEAKETQQNATTAQETAIADKPVTRKRTRRVAK